jgi:hypothetical protein
MPPEFQGPAHDGSGAMEPDIVPAIERLADDIAVRVQMMAKELERQQEITAALLRHVGEKGICKGLNCRQEILFVFHRDTGKLTPYNFDGTPHFATCVDRNQFHRRKNVG